LAPYSKPKLDTIFESPSFKLGTLPKAQALNLVLTTFLSLTFKPKPFQAFKNFKISNQLKIPSIKELRNPDSLSLIEIRRSKVKSLSDSPLKNNIFSLLSSVLHFVFGKNKYFEKPHSLFYLFN